MCVQPDHVLVQPLKHLVAPVRPVEKMTALPHLYPFSAKVSKTDIAWMLLWWIMALTESKAFCSEGPQKVLCSETTIYRCLEEMGPHTQIRQDVCQFSSARPLWELDGQLLTDFLRTFKFRFQRHWIGSSLSTRQGSSVCIINLQKRG